MMISTVPICSRKLFSPLKKKLCLRVFSCSSVMLHCSFDWRSAYVCSRPKDLMTVMLSRILSMPWLTA